MVIQKSASEASWYKSWLPHTDKIQYWWSAPREDQAWRWVSCAYVLERFCEAGIGGMAGQALRLVQKRWQRVGAVRFVGLEGYVDFLEKVR